MREGSERVGEEDEGQYKRKKKKKKLTEKLTVTLIIQVISETKECRILFYFFFLTQNTDALVKSHTKSVNFYLALSNKKPTAIVFAVWKIDLLL